MTKQPLPCGGAFIQVKMGPDDEGRYVGKDSFDARKEEGYQEQKEAPSDSTLDPSQETIPVTQVG